MNSWKKVIKNNLIFLVLFFIIILGSSTSADVYVWRENLVGVFPVSSSQAATPSNVRTYNYGYQLESEVNFTGTAFAYSSEMQGSAQYKSIPVVYLSDMYKDGGQGLSFIGGSVCLLVNDLKSTQRFNVAGNTLRGYWYSVGSDAFTETFDVTYTSNTLIGSNTAPPASRALNVSSIEYLISTTLVMQPETALFIANDTQDVSQVCLIYSNLTGSQNNYPFPFVFMDEIEWFICTYNRTSSATSSIYFPANLDEDITLISGFMTGTGYKSYAGFSLAVAPMTFSFLNFSGFTHLIWYSPYNYFDYPANYYFPEYAVNYRGFSGFVNPPKTSPVAFILNDILNVKIKNWDEFHFTFDGEGNGLLVSDPALLEFMNQAFDKFFSGGSTGQELSDTLTVIKNIEDTTSPDGASLASGINALNSNLTTVLGSLSSINFEWWAVLPSSLLLALVSVFFVIVIMKFVRR